MAIDKRMMIHWKDVFNETIFNETNFEKKKIVSAKNPIFQSRDHKYFMLPTFWVVGSENFFSNILFATACLEQQKFVKNVNTLTF